ncbi:MAG TPA: hypothetical protein VG964_00315, partial [Candidatus Saccharimonadales bacterium]|nr:hypothetical protein [Candidatus Saccharimonadales bacterium]
SASGAAPGLSITFVSGIPGTINIMSGGSRLGTYTGPHKSLMLRCMGKKYIYRGEIKTVRNALGKIYATCNVEGMGLA